MVHPQVLPNVKHKCFCFVCSFVRPCTRYRTTELPYVFPNIGLPWLNASRPTSSCHDSFRLDTSVSRYIQRPMHRTTPSFVSNSSALRTLPSSLFFPPKISHHLMDQINRSRYLYSFLHLDILLFIFHAVYRKREYFAILKNKLSPRDDKIDWLKKRKEREREGERIPTRGKEEREERARKIVNESEAGKLKDREILTVAGGRGESFRMERDDFRRIQVFLAAISRNVNAICVASTVDNRLADAVTIRERRWRESAARGLTQVRCQGVSTGFGPAAAW